MITLTRDLIHSAATSNCGFRKSQLEALGVSWPPKKGWLSKLAGTTVTQMQWDLFVHLGQGKKQKRVDTKTPLLFQFL